MRSSFWKEKSKSLGNPSSPCSSTYQGAEQSSCQQLWGFGSNCYACCYCCSQLVRLSGDLMLFVLGNYYYSKSSNEVKEDEKVKWFLVSSYALSCSFIKEGKLNSLSCISSSYFGYSDYLSEPLVVEFLSWNMKNLLSKFINLPEVI